MYDTLLIDLPKEHRLATELSEGIRFESFDRSERADRTLLLSEDAALLTAADQRGMGTLAVTDSLSALAVRTHLSSYDDDPKDSSLYLFDLGGVVVKDFTMLTKLTERFGVDRRELEADYRHYVYPLMEGYLSSGEYWKRAKEHFDLPPFIDDPFATAFTPTINGEMVAIITALKEQNKRVVCASNTMDSHWQILKKMRVLSLFDYPYASHLLEVIKPKRRFFELILEKEGFAASEAYFIDDSEANVLAARRAGIRSMLYKDTPKKRASERLASAFNFL